jgi:hypothetical protein
MRECVPEIAGKIAAGGSIAAFWQNELDFLEQKQHRREST